MRKKLNSSHFSFHKADILNSATYAVCKQAFDRSALLCAAYCTPFIMRCQHSLGIRAYQGTAVSPNKNTAAVCT